MSVCDICLEEICGGTHNCDCSVCDKRSTCYRVLTPTVRITTRCTQQCGHCCFECSPRRSDFMSIEVAQNLKKFLENNNITFLNLMGGEFFTHPEWQKIFRILIPGMTRVRLVTNGDWAQESDKISLFLRQFQNVKVSISKDIWHTNNHVEAATTLCAKYGLDYVVGNNEDDSPDVIVPVGRGEYHYGIYSMFSCYCRNPVHKYGFLITEDGGIHKCSFGAWRYAQIDDFLEDGFAVRFKEFNKKFYSVFIGNCRSCLRGYASRKIDFQRRR